jgi:hypothetical protein
MANAEREFKYWESEDFALSGVQRQSPCVPLKLTTFYLMKLHFFKPDLNVLKFKFICYE